MSIVRFPDPRIQLGTIEEAGVPLLLPPQLQHYHTLITGQSGTGKTELLKGLVLQHLNRGHTILLLEPHGDLSVETIAYLLQAGYYTHPKAFERLVYIDFAAESGFLPLNILAPTRTASDPKVIALNALEAISRAWPELTKAPQFQTLFLSSVLTLIANRLPITFLFQLLSDQVFRSACLAKVADPTVQQTFAMYEQMGKGGQAQAAGTLWRRSFLLLFSDTLRLTLGQPDNGLDLRMLMDHHQSVIFNLGGIADAQTKKLLGCLLMLQIEQAAFSRGDLPPSARVPCWFFLDEWASFAASEQTLSTILEQLRKFGLAMTFAGQSFGQIASARLAGAFENCRTQVYFALGRTSAEIAARQLATGDDTMTRAQQQQLLIQDLQNLPTGTTYVKLGNQSAVRVKTLTIPRLAPDHDQLHHVLSTYSGRYQRSRTQAESVIAGIQLPGSVRRISPEAPTPITAAFRTIFDSDE